MIAKRKILIPVAAIAILAAAFTLPAATAHAAPTSPTETSVLDLLWQRLEGSLAELEAGARSLFAASGADTDPDPGTEIGSGADPNGIQAIPDLGGTTSAPTQEPDGGN